MDFLNFVSVCIEFKTWELVYVELQTLVPADSYVVLWNWKTI